MKRYTMKFLAVCENCDDCKEVYASEFGFVAGVACGRKLTRFPLVGLVAELPDVPDTCPHRNELVEKEVKANV